MLHDNFLLLEICMTGQMKLINSLKLVQEPKFLTYYWSWWFVEWGVYVFVNVHMSYSDSNFVTTNSLIQNQRVIFQMQLFILHSTLITLVFCIYPDVHINIQWRLFRVSALKLFTAQHIDIYSPLG